MLNLEGEPVSLAEAKKHLGMRTPIRDDEISRLLVAARERIELFTGRSLRRLMVSEVLPGFDAAVPLQFGPVHSVQAVRYVEPGGQMVELEGEARAFGPIGNRWWLYPPASERWPVLGDPAIVTIEYLAGFGPLGENEEGEEVPVPEMLKQAILLLVGTWFENHEGAVVGRSAIELPFGVKSLCQDFRPSGVA